jgi:hypothetical protein
MNEKCIMALNPTLFDYTASPNGDDSHSDSDSAAPDGHTFGPTDFHDKSTGHSQTETDKTNDFRTLPRLTLPHSVSTSSEGEPTLMQFPNLGVQGMRYTAQSPASYFVGENSPNYAEMFRDTDDTSRVGETSMTDGVGEPSSDLPDLAGTRDTPPNTWDQMEHPTIFTGNPSRWTTSRTDSDGIDYDKIDLFSSTSESTVDSTGGFRDDDDVHTVYGLTGSDHEEATRPLPPRHRGRSGHRRLSSHKGRSRRSVDAFAAIADVSDSTSGRAAWEKATDESSHEVRGVYRRGVGLTGINARAGSVSFTPTSKSTNSDPKTRRALESLFEGKTEEISSAVDDSSAGPMPSIKFNGSSVNPYTSVNPYSTAAGPYPSSRFQVQSPHFSSYTLDSDSDTESYNSDDDVSSLSDSDIESIDPTITRTEMKALERSVREFSDVDKLSSSDYSRQTAERAVAMKQPPRIVLLRDAMDKLVNAKERRAQALFEVTEELRRVLKKQQHTFVKYHAELTRLINRQRQVKSALFDQTLLDPAAFVSTRPGWFWKPADE